MIEPRLTRFIRGELSSDEISKLEAELERSPSLHRALLEHARTATWLTAAATPPSPALIEGPARLVLGSTLGEGGMATVRRGVQTNLGRPVAVKTLRDATPEGAALLLQEARLTARLQHPNIVPVHEIVRGQGGELQVVLKQIDGVPWAAVMDQADILRARFGAEDPLDFNLTVLIAICNALAFAHEQSVIHRDVKPSNVMIGNFGEIYLLDWGIAGLWGARKDPDVAHVEDSPVAGTPAFMAPEQIEGEPALLGPWTDVYLLGATLYYVLSGRAPHTDSQNTSGDALHPRPRERLVEPLDSEAPRGLVALATEAMAPNPQDRLPTPQAFRAALEAFRRRRGSLHLATRADESLRRALGDDPSGGGERREVERRLGEAEFGYRAAMEAWPDNRHAVEGLERITVYRIEAALAAGKLDEAERLFEVLREPPPALRTRLIETRAEHARRLRYADRSNWYRAVTVGVVARTLILAIFAPFWIAGWVAQAVWPPSTNRPIIALLGGYVALGVIVVVARGLSILKDHFNRINVLGAAIAMLSALLWTAAAERSGLAVGVTQLGLLLIFPLTFGVVALTSDPRALPPAVVGFVCFLGAAMAPTRSGAALAASAVVMAISVVANNLWMRRRARDPRNPLLL